MGYESWLKDGLLKRAAPDRQQITKQLNRVSKDLQTAEVLGVIDRTWSFTIAYHAMIRAGRAFMYSQGYLPTTINPHKTIVAFMRDAFGDHYRDVLFRFDRMRRKRHDFIYSSENHTTEREAREAIKTAKDLFRVISECIEPKDSQKLI